MTGSSLATLAGRLGSGCSIRRPPAWPRSSDVGTPRGEVLGEEDPRSGAGQLGCLLQIDRVDERVRVAMHDPPARFVAVVRRHKTTGAPCRVPPSRSPAGTARRLTMLDKRYYVDPGQKSPANRALAGVLVARELRCSRSQAKPPTACGCCTSTTVPARIHRSQPLPRRGTDRRRRLALEDAITRPAHDPSEDLSQTLGPRPDSPLEGEHWERAARSHETYRQRSGGL